MTDKREKTLSTQVLDKLEPAIYSTRFLVAAASFIGALLLIAYCKNFAVVSYENFMHMMVGDDIGAEEGIIMILSCLDSLMVIHVSKLIIVGSWRIYVRSAEHSDENSGVTQVEKHLDSGLLKEKMASSLMGVSSLALLRYLIVLAETGDHSPFIVGAICLIHLLLIGGYFVMNFTNTRSKRAGGSSEHDSHASESPKEETHA